MGISVSLWAKSLAGQYRPHRQCHVGLFAVLPRVGWRVDINSVQWTHWSRMCELPAGAGGVGEEPPPKEK